MIYETMNAHTIHDTTHMMVGLHHHPDLLPLQGQLTAATSRQNRPSNRRGFLNRPSNRRGFSLDSYIGRLSLKGTWKGILEVSAFLVYYITILCSSTSQITRTSQQVWRVHLVYVASGITSSRHEHWRTDQPSYREPGPFGGCNFLSHKCFCSKETLEEHLTQDAAQVFLWIKNTQNPRVRFPVGTQKFGEGILSTSQAGLRRAAPSNALAKGGRPAFLPETGPLRGL